MFCCARVLTSKTEDAAAIGRRRRRLSSESPAKLKRRMGVAVSGGGVGEVKGRRGVLERRWRRRELRRAPVKSAGLFLSLCCVFGNTKTSGEGGFERGIEWSRRTGYESSYGGEIARQTAAGEDASRKMRFALTRACGDGEDRGGGCEVALGLLLAHGGSGALEVDQGRGSIQARLGLCARCACVRPEEGDRCGLHGQWLNAGIGSGYEHGAGAVRASGAGVPLR